MTDERMLRAFSELDMAAMPDPAFANRLYASLAADLGLKPATSTGTAVVPVHAVRETGRGRARSPFRRRRAMLALLAAALLLLAMLAGALLIAGQLRPLTPLETMERSRAAYVAAPAVRFVITDDMGATTVTGDGRGTWRSTSPDMAPGDYFLYDGARTGAYTASLRAWRVMRVEDGGPPYPFNSEFTWIAITFPDLVARLDPVACSDAMSGLSATGTAGGTPAPAMRVAGRDTVVIACPAIGMTYWVDTETALVLRTEAAPDSRYWRGPAGGPTVTEVTAFETLASVNAADFDWSGPARTARTGPIPGTRLVIGARPPSWSGTTLDGTPITLPDPGAPMAVLFWEAGSESSQATDRVFEAVTRTTPGLRGLAVSMDEPGTLAGYRTQHPSAVPQVAAGGALLAAWGIPYISALVLLDADGRVAELASASPLDTDLAATLEAFAAGSALVVPAPQAGTSPPPVLPEVTCDPETHVVCVERGDPLPAWVGRTAGGTAISGARLAGRPVVLWLDSPGVCGGPCSAEAREPVAQMAELASAYDGRAQVVLIAALESEPGATQALLDETGAAFDLVYDWDRTIGRALGQETSGAILLDADGRLVEQWTGMVDPARVRSALDGVVDQAP